MSWFDGTFPPAETTDFSNSCVSPLHHGQEITGITEQHINVETTLNQDNEMVNNPEVRSSSARSKKRKLKSKVWDDFRKYVDEDGKEWAECNHCKKRFDGSSKSGTTHLKNHSERCQIKRSNAGGSGAAGKSADKTGDSLTITPSANIIKGKSKVDEELNQLDKTRLMIKNWVPLKYIEDDLHKIYEEEKEKLMRYFHELPSRFHLFFDYFYSDQSMIYANVHFINDNWELKKKVVYVSYTDDFSSCAEEVEFMVKDWNIDKDGCSIVMPYYFMVNFDERGSVPLAGNFCALSGLVSRLRCHCLWSPLYFKMLGYTEYVSSNAHDSKIEKAVDKAAAANSKIISQPLIPPTDDGDKDEYEFKLVEWAVGLKEAFWELEQTDPNGFKQFNFTKEEWDLVTAIYELVKDARDIANSWSVNCKYTTPNVYFQQICRLYKLLFQWPKSDMASIWKSNKREFDKFGSNLNILAIAVVLDPRFKMDIVKHWYVEIYGNDSNVHIEKIIDEVHNTFSKYAKAVESSQTSAMLDLMVRPCTSLHQVDYVASSTQSELDRYLKDSKFPAVEDFDILAWWHSNSPVYPALAKMARDYLAIPIGVKDSLDSSIVKETENIFSSKELDVNIKKALVHTKAWL